MLVQRLLTSVGTTSHRHVVIPASDIGCLSFACRYGAFDINIRDINGEGLLFFVADVVYDQADEPPVKKFIRSH